MFREQLLTPHDTLIFKLINRVNAQNGPVRKAELADHLKINASSLAALLNETQQFIDADDHHEAIYFKVNPRSVELNLNGQCTIADFLYPLIHRSDLFQIIMHLYHAPTLTITQLGTELLVSDASIKRRLADLNDLLAEFNLSFQQGRLEGSELQIRHFAFEFMTHLIPENRRALPVPSANINDFIVAFQRLFHVTLTPIQEQQLIVWLQLSLTRTKANQSPDKTTPDFSALAEFDDLTILLKRSLFYQREDALPFEVNALLCHCFTDDLFTSNDDLLTRMVTIIEALEPRIKKTNTFMLSEMTLSHLTSDNQDHWLHQNITKTHFQARVLPGYIFIMDKLYLHYYFEAHKNLLDQPFLTEPVIRQATKLLGVPYSREATYIRASYTRLSADLIHHPDHYITVGIDFTFPMSLDGNIAQQIRHAISSGIDVVFLPNSRHQQFDLMLIDHSVPTFHHQCPHYYISNYGTQKDYTNLAHQITALYAAKYA
ncbi:helix-turn-helix domain-containing protein [Furfurilactobacillus sp. WILCCON 0119]